MFRIKDLGKLNYCLGIEIRRNGGSISLSQTGYVREILNRFNISDCNPVKTALALGNILIKSVDETGHEKDFPFRELIGTLTYAALTTRPDITHSVSSLAQFNCNPSTQDWAAAKRVLR